jgi:hypothetical protein
VRAPRVECVCARDGRPLWNIYLHRVVNSRMLIGSSADGIGQLSKMRVFNSNLTARSVGGVKQHKSKDQPKALRRSNASMVTRTTQAQQSGRQIDYAAFWERTMAEAQAAAQRLGSPSYIAEQQRRLKTFPKVFVYELPDDLSEGFDPSKASDIQIFGPPQNWGANATWKKYSNSWWKLVSTERRAELARNVRDTNHYSFTRAMLYRLWNSPRYRTKDPSKADIFFAPIFPLPKRGHLISAQCSNVTAKRIHKALPHLTEATAHKHLFVLSKEHYEGYLCKDWWSAPEGVFRRVMRLSYSVQQPATKQADEYYWRERGADWLSKGCTNLVYAAKCAHLTYPNTESVPYISNVHWPVVLPDPAANDAKLAGSTQGPPWADTSPRPLLMLFLGGGLHGDTRVRRMMWGMCSRYKDPKKCLQEKYDLSRGPLLKYESTFCLEPPGDSPYRRSTTDSIAMGCIPVFFSSLQEDMYSWLWEDWRTLSSVQINRTSFLRGEIDLYELLSSIPTQLLALMRRTLAQNGRKFTVSTTDDPGDSIHNLLHGAVQMSQRLASSSSSSAD